MHACMCSTPGLARWPTAAVAVPHRPSAGSPCPKLLACPARPPPRPHRTWFRAARLLFRMRTMAPSGLVGSPRLAEAEALTLDTVAVRSDASMPSTPPGPSDGCARRARQE